MTATTKKKPAPPKITYTHTAVGGTKNGQSKSFAVSHDDAPTFGEDYRCVARTLLRDGVDQEVVSIYVPAAQFVRLRNVCNGYASAYLLSIFPRLEA